MKYRNTHPTDSLSFSFGQTSYDVPVGGEVELEDKWHSWVVARGLFLVPVAVKAPAPEAKKPAAEPEPPKPALELKKPEPKAPAAKPKSEPVSKPNAAASRTSSD